MLNCCYGFFKIISVQSVSEYLSMKQKITRLLGFELLVYSYAPIGFPTPCCAKVVESEIWTIQDYHHRREFGWLTGSMTAPVTGS